jgi:hypothetical protein
MARQEGVVLCVEKGMQPLPARQFSEGKTDVVLEHTVLSVVYSGGGGGSRANQGVDSTQVTDSRKCHKG